MKKTKIVATLGPASEKPEMLRKLIEAGVNIFRVNCSHASGAEIGRHVRSVRAASKRLGKPIAVMLDLQGPKIRVGEFIGGRLELKTGQTIALKVTREKSDGAFIPVQYAGFYKDIKNTGRILLDDGKMELSILSKKNGTVLTRVVNGGVLQDKKGINLPDGSISAAPITTKDLRDLKTGIEAGVDYVALSFVREGEDIRKLKRLIAQSSRHIEVVAKIERHEAIENLDGILEATDAVMVARGDLGMEIPLSKVPVIQSEIIRRCVELAKPVIVATQMMESMVSNPRPSRAEVSDVSSAVQSYADALMLSVETSKGGYPVECVRAMAMAAVEMENHQSARRGGRLWEMGKDPSYAVEQAVARAGVGLAELLDARGIIVVTQHGYMPKRIAALHPLSPVFAFTSHIETMRKLALVRGVSPFHMNPKDADTKNLSVIFGELKKRGHLKTGDRVVVVVSTGGASGTNKVRVETVK